MVIYVKPKLTPLKKPERPTPTAVGIKKFGVAMIGAAIVELLLTGNDFLNGYTGS
jgi:hypothetical protein